MKSAKHALKQQLIAERKHHRVTRGGAASKRPLRLFEYLALRKLHTKNSQDLQPIAQPAAESGARPRS